MKRAGVTTFEFMVLMSLFLAAIGSAAYAGDRFGWIGAVLGFPTGFLVAFLTYFVVIYFIAFVQALVSEGIPYLPNCRNGKCKSRLLDEFGDYERVPLDGQLNVFQCQCGDRYQKRRKERTVVQIHPDNSSETYMVWKSFRGWYPVQERESNS